MTPDANTCWKISSRKPLTNSATTRREFGELVAASISFYVAVDWFEGIASSLRGPVVWSITAEAKANQW